MSTTASTSTINSSDTRVAGVHSELFPAQSSAQTVRLQPGLITPPGLSAATSDSSARAAPAFSSEIFKFDPRHPTAVAPAPSAEASAHSGAADKLKAAPIAIRKRFYPAQWRKVAQPKLEAVAKSRGLSIQWIGWDRSLPRLYLPLGGLSRLMTEVVDAVTAQLSSMPGLEGPGWQPIRLRVSSQSSGPASSLILAIEHERWHCNTASQAALNSTSMLASAEMQWDRVRRQVMTLGGAISVSPMPGGGASLRIELPIDQPQALVKAWLDQQLRSPFSQVIQERSIYLHIVGRRAAESTTQLMAADERLQSLIEPSEMVYRIDQARWLWLRSATELPAFARTDAWLVAQVAAWRVRLAGQGNQEPSLSMRWQLAGSIATTMQRLIGAKVAPLDGIVQRLATAAHRAVQAPINPPHRQPPQRQPSQRQPSDRQPPQRQPSQAARWQYPI